MPGLESLLRILSMLAALVGGEGVAAHDARDERFAPRFVVEVRDAVAALADREPLDGQPPRRLRPVDDEALDGPVAARPPRPAPDHREQTDRPNHAVRERATGGDGRDRRAADRPARARRATRESAGNGGNASAEANGGTVAIGSIPGDAEVDGNASVEISTEDGIAVEIDASGDAVTASAAGEDGDRAERDGPRRRGSIDPHRRG